MKVDKDTMLRVTISERRGSSPKSEYSKPELFCIVPFKFLSKVTGMRHPDAERRVKRELEGDTPVAFVYETIGGVGETRRYGIEVQKGVCVR